MKFIFRLSSQEYKVCTSGVVTLVHDNRNYTEFIHDYVGNTHMFFMVQGVQFYNLTIVVIM